MILEQRPKGCREVRETCGYLEEKCSGRGNNCAKLSRERPGTFEKRLEAGAVGAEGGRRRDKVTSQRAGTPRNHPGVGHTIIPILLSSERLDNLPETTQLIKRCI